MTTEAVKCPWNQIPVARGKTPRDEELQDILGHLTRAGGHIYKRESGDQHAMMEKGKYINQSRAAAVLILAARRKEGSGKECRRAAGEGT